MAESIDPPARAIQSDFHCAACDKSFNEKRALRRHYNTQVHCEKTGDQPATFSCSQCGKRFSRRDLCRRHETEVHERRKRKAGRQRINIEESTHGSKTIPTKPSTGEPPRAMPYYATSGKASARGRGPPLEGSQVVEAPFAQATSGGSHAFTVHEVAFPFDFSDLLMDLDGGALMVAHMSGLSEL